MNILVSVSKEVPELKWSKKNRERPSRHVQNHPDLIVEKGFAEYGAAVSKKIRDHIIKEKITGEKDNQRPCTNPKNLGEGTEIKHIHVSLQFWQ
jgi:hypothetical protein